VAWRRADGGVAGKSGLVQVEPIGTEIVVSGAAPSWAARRRASASGFAAPPSSDLVVAMIQPPGRTQHGDLSMRSLGSRAVVRAEAGEGEARAHLGQRQMVEAGGNEGRAAPLGG
jgi:hypothetical protein